MVVAPVLPVRSSTLILTLICAVELPALAQAPFIQDAHVVTEASGRATSVEIKVVGGTPPYSGTLHLALPGASFEDVTLTQSPLPDVLTGALPAAYHTRPFGYFISINDAGGVAAEKGTTAQPLFFAPDEPPAPDAPPQLETDSGAATLPAPTVEAPPAESALAAQEPPHPSALKDKRSRARPAQGEDENLQSASPSRRRARTERVVSCCGVPIWGFGAQPFFLISSAFVGLAAVTVGAVAVLFLIDLSQAQRMLGAVDNAQRRGDPAPQGCGNWNRCSQRYEQAFWIDAIAVIGGVLLSLTLGAGSVALLLTAGAFRRE